MAYSAFDLNGRKALVCGGAGDLGSAIVTALHGAGVQVVVLDCIPDLDGWVAERT